MVHMLQASRWHSDSHVAMLIQLRGSSGRDPPRDPTKDSHMEAFVFQWDSVTKSCATETQDCKHTKDNSIEMCMYPTDFTWI